MLIDNIRVIKIAQFLFPAQRLFFFLPIVLLCVLVIDLSFTKYLNDNNLIYVLLACLWGFIIYLFISLLGDKRIKSVTKKRLLYTIINKFKRIVHSFFIIVFIVLFLFTVFYSYKILRI